MKYSLDKLNVGDGVVIPLWPSLFDPKKEIERQRRTIQVQACTYGGRHNKHFTVRKTGNEVLVRRVK